MLAHVFLPDLLDHCLDTVAVEDSLVLTTWATRAAAVCPLFSHVPKRTIFPYHAAWIK